MQRTVTAKPYRPRPIRFLELLREGEWRVKVYGISARGPQPGTSLVEAAMRLATTHLHAAARSASPWPHHGSAVLIAHEAREANFVLLDWWVAENMLRHQVWTSPLDAPARLEDFSPAGIAACVWELKVIAFERDAWVQHVLANPNGPDLAAYHAARLDAEI